MLTKTGLRDLFSHYGFHPLKRFGENYLIDANIKDKIVHEVCVGPGDAVLEIGPGFGALTLDLAATGAKIYAVEKDKKAYAIFKEMLGDAHPRVRLICADILDFDLSGIKTKAKIRIIGNLPYYITTPIIEYIIAHKDRISSAFITVQREVALRMMAYPGSKEYGSLSCFVQYHTTPVQLFAIKRTLFYPEPEIDSSFLRLDINETPPVKVADEALLFKVMRGAFNQRRKTILNSLARKEVLDLPKGELAALLDKAGVAATSRPESLSLSDFARITNAVSGDSSH